MNRTPCVLVFLLPLLFGTQSFACSPPRPETDEEHAARLLKAFTTARTVVVADAVDIKQTKLPRDRFGNEVIEEASMKVREVLKGAHEVGGIVAIRTEVICCTCTVTVKNSPPWIYELNKDGADVPIKLSGRWLLFVFDEGPISLTSSGPSEAWELDGEQDAEMLRQALSARQRVGTPPSKPAGRQGVLPRG